MRTSIIIAGLVGAITIGNAPAIIAEAQADPQTDQYTRQNMPAVCLALDMNPTVAGIEDEGSAIMDDGLTGEQALEVVVRSVIGWCPEHMPELDATIAKWQKADMKR